MSLMEKFTKWRRDRMVTQVIHIGKRLDVLYVSRRGVDSKIYPEDAAYLDGLITIDEAARKRLLTKLKETA